VLAFSGAPFWGVADVDCGLYETKMSSPCLRGLYEEGGQRA